MGRRLMVGGDEYDANSSWGRKYLIYIQRTGVRSWIKRKARRRERQRAKQAARQALEAFSD